MTLTEDILAQARALGFDVAGVTPVGPPPHYPAFAAWLAAGYHGEMTYLSARAGQRADPTLLAPAARSMIVLAASYNPGPPPAGWADPSRGRIARYAWSPDYHEILKSRLYELDAFIRQRSGRTTPGKACVDTAPLLERDFAARAGLGFIGRNTCLIVPGLGSWTFLAALLVPEDLSPGPSPMRGGEICSPSPAREDVHAVFAASAQPTCGTADEKAPLPRAWHFRSARHVGGGPFHPPSHREAARWRRARHEKP